MCIFMVLDKNIISYFKKLTENIRAEVMIAFYYGPLYSIYGVHIKK